MIATRSERTTRSGPWVPVLVATAVAAALVLHHLGTKPLWLDEAVSVSVARRPLPRLFTVLGHHDANAGLYYLILHGWLRLGRGTAWVRLPTAACFVAAAGLAAWVLGRWKGAWLGAAGGLLVATNPFLLFYGQEARPYALAVLLAIASTAALFWDDGNPSPLPYVIATAALLYADLFAVLFVAAQAAVVGAIQGRRLSPVLLRCWAVIAGVTGPLALVVVLREGSQISWLPRPSFGDLVHTLTGMGGGWIGLGVMVGLGGLAVASGRWKGTPDRDRLVAPVLLGAFVLPPSGLWLVAQAAPSFLSRYVICSAVALIGLATIGLHRLHRVPATALVLLVVAVGTRGVVRLEARPYKYEDPPAVVAFIAARARPGDAIAFGSGGLRTVVDAYLSRGRPFPDDVAVVPGAPADLYAREVSPMTLERRLGTVDRLWLVTDPTDRRYPSTGALAPIRAAVLGSFHPVLTASFPGMDVTLDERG